LIYFICPTKLLAGLENSSSVKGIISLLVKNNWRIFLMKKLMVVVAAFAFAAAVYAQDAKPVVKADAVKPAVVAAVCADCAKLKADAKAGEVAKLCAACQKKADDAKKAAPAPVK
jgi:hypothetical protein